MKPKPWHIAVVVAGLVLGAGSAVRVLMASPPASVLTVIHCVDVETGDVYRIDTEKTRVMLPARHPGSGRVSLVRISKNEQGAWIVKERDRETLGMLDQGVKNTAVDAETGGLLVELKNAVEYAPTSHKQK